MDSPPLQQFRKRLSDFIFFHLGSDARWEIQPSPQGASVSIEHPRVRPFRFELSLAELEQLAGDPGRFEVAMLDQLTQHRKS